MQIRSGTPSDTDRIAAFNCFDIKADEAINQNRCLVAIIDGDVAGFVIYKQRGLIGKNFVEYLVVNEPFRRKGVAEALLRAAENELGPCRLFISTEADNTPMLTLLNKYGWSPSGQLDQINDSGQAEVFFYKDLPRHGQTFDPT